MHLDWLYCVEKFDNRIVNTIIGSDVDEYSSVGRCDSSSNTQQIIKSLNQLSGIRYQKVIRGSLTKPAFLTFILRIHASENEKCQSQDCQLCQQWHLGIRFQDVIADTAWLTFLVYLGLVMWFGKNIFYTVNNRLKQRLNRISIIASSLL